MKLTAITFLAAAFVLAAPAQAQLKLEPTTVRIESSADRTKALNIETGDIAAATVAGPGWFSAKWVLEPIFGTTYFRMKSYWKPSLFLNTEKGYAEATPIQDGWYSAQWQMKEQPAKSGSDRTWTICNRWRDECLSSVTVAGDKLAMVPLAQAPVAAGATWALPGFYGFEAIAAPLETAATPAARTSTESGGELTGQGTGDTIVGALNSFGNSFSTWVPGTYRVMLDYCHSDLSNTNTNSKITVEFWSEIAGKAATKVGQTSLNRLPPCSIFGAPASLDADFRIDNASAPVTYIIVKTDGADAAFIDQIQLFEASKQIIWEGRSNGGGWCLSTDANDAGEWSDNLSGGCSAEIRFNRQ